MSNKDPDDCEHCGAKMRQYRHHLNAGLLSALEKMYEKSPTGPVAIADIGLTRSEYTNYSKLAYWFLAVRWRVQTGHKGGIWRVTDSGRAFLGGREKTQKTVVVYRNSIVRWEGAKIGPADVDPNYKIRPEYIVDSEGVELAQRALDLGATRD